MNPLDHLPPHPFDWTITGSERPLQDRWLSVRADTVQMPNGNILSPFYALEYPHYVHVVPITAADEIVLVRQYRHGVQRTLLEIPAGTMDANETLLATAQRELLEETGYTAATWHELPITSPNPATHTNLGFNLLALGAELTAVQALDDSEQIEVVVMPLDEFVPQFLAGGMLGALNASAVFYALLKLGQI